MSRTGASALGEGSSASIRLQSAPLDIGFMSTAEACSDVTTATAIGPRHFAPADTAAPVVAGSTPPDSPEPMEVSRHETPRISTSSEVDVSGRLLRSSESLLDATRVSQASGLANPYPHSIPQPTPQTDEQQVSPTVGEPIAPAVEHPVTPPIEESIPTDVEDTIATIPQPIQGIPAARFSLSPFQRPTLLDTLIQRLRTKRVLVHSWRADRCSIGQATPPTRHRRENLDPTQIFEYAKSGGKSINASSHLVKEKVAVSSPLLQETPWLTVCRHHLCAENHCWWPLLDEKT
jgi:hypothetical protein